MCPASSVYFVACHCQREVSEGTGVKVKLPIVCIALKTKPTESATPTARWALVIYSTGHCPLDTLVVLLESDYFSDAWETTARLTVGVTSRARAIALVVA
jgi:hypothetical protein